MREAGVVRTIMVYILNAYQKDSANVLENVSKPHHQAYTSLNAYA